MFYMKHKTHAFSNKQIHTALISFVNVFDNVSRMKLLKDEAQWTRLERLAIDPRAQESVKY